MGGSEKHKKSKRKPQSKRPNNSSDNNNNNNNNNPPRTTDSNPELVQTLSDKSTEMVRARYYPAPSEWDQNPELGQAMSGDPGKNNDISTGKLDPYVCLDINMKDWKFYTEEQLEELLLRKLEAIYNEAYVRLISYGHPPDVVLKAILTNGHGFGNLDILTNIVQNSLGYIKTGFVIDDGTYRECQQVFGDMKMLVKNSLTVMVYLLRQVRPNLIKGDAMWCLLMCNFHLGVASTIKLPFVTNEGESQVAVNNRSLYASSGVCKVLGDQLSGDDKAHDFSKNGPSDKLDVWMERNLSIAKSYKLTPSLEAKLKMNIGNFAAACRATVKMSPKQLQASKSSLPSKNSTESFEWEDSCMVNLVLSSFGNLSLNEKSESESLDPKVEIISRLVHNIKEIKQQVKERKEWAQKKVIQAAKKLSHDLSELKILRMEREGKQQLKNYKLELEEETMKKLMQLEDALRKTGCQADLANTAVKRLEVENAEIRAEVEAFKLSASESDKICVEVVRREKKCLKKILALEKQNTKYREEIEEEKKKSLHLHQQLVDLKKAQEEIEVMRRQEVKAKELAIAQVQEELRLKEEVEANIKRKQDALSQKMALDSQRCKDDMLRLEKEISHLELSLDSSNPHYQRDVFFTGELGPTRPERDALEIMLPDLSELIDLSEGEVIHDRVCLICMENDASIVFLPCAHQVLCANCTKDHCKNVEAKCPCCQDPIAQRIRVYGASS